MSYKEHSSLDTILVIHENPVALTAMRATLEKAGLRVVTRDRISGAIAAVLHERPDLVLLDVNMPQMAGDSLADVLSRARATRSTTVVLYSSVPVGALRAKSLAASAAGFIQSTSPLDFVRQVRAFLKPRDSQGALRVSAEVSEEVGQSGTRIRTAQPVDQRPSSLLPGSRSVPTAASTLPAPNRSSRPSVPPARRASGLRLGLPTTLFLDDDLAVLTGYRRVFSSEEMNGEYLTSPDQALCRISDPESPDVVVTDLVMPGINGIELYRRALELDPTWRHRFVFVTGASSVGYVAEFLRQVGERAFEKPVDLQRLRDAIFYAATGARIFRKQSTLR